MFLRQNKLPLTVLSDEWYSHSVKPVSAMHCCRAPTLPHGATLQLAAALLRLRLCVQHSGRMLGSLLSNQHSSGRSGQRPQALTARTACSAVTLVAPGTGVASPLGSSVGG